MQRRHLPGIALVAVGLVLAGIQAAHALQQTNVAVAIAVDGLPFAAMGIGVAFAGGWAWRAGEYEADGLRIGGWCLAGVVTLAAVAALVLFGQRVTTGSLARASYLTMDLVTVGAIGGVLVGLYDVQSRQRRLALARERDRIERFAGKAADVNNYGRAIYSAETQDGVAAYVIQAVATFVDFGETAVVVVEDGDAGEGRLPADDGPTRGDEARRGGNPERGSEAVVSVVASTVTSIDDDTLGSLALDARAQDARDVIVHERPGLPTPLPEDVTPVVSVLVAEDDGRATAVIALGDADATVDETDRQLLELVVSHAAATLRRLDVGAQAVSE